MLYNIMGKTIKFYVVIVSNTNSYNIIEARFVRCGMVCWSYPFHHGMNRILHTICWHDLYFRLL